MADLKSGSTGASEANSEPAARLDLRSITARRTCQPVQEERGQQRLGFDVAVRGRTLQPARAFRLAARHARAFEVAPSDPVLGVGDAGPRREGKQRECLRRFALFAQANRPAQRGVG